MTLHRFYTLKYQGKSYWGDTIHVEYLTVNDLIENIIPAFRLEYEFRKPPFAGLDVVFVGGYADLLMRHSKEFIYNGLWAFTNTVLSIGKIQNPTKPNTVAVATFMYPPALCWFEEKEEAPYNYINQMEKVNWLNERIKYLNLANNAPYYPGFHTYGVRTDTVKGVDSKGAEFSYQIKSHRWPHFVEQRRRDKLTLRPDRLFVMGQAVNNYFYERT